MGDLEGASRGAAPLQARLAARSATDHLPLLVEESIRAILIRVFIAQDDLERADRLLDELQTTAEAGRRFGRLIEVNLLRALALQKQNYGRVTPAALEYLLVALDLAEPEEYVLLFLEESPAVIPLLAAVVQHPAAPARLKGYAQRLLDAFPRDTKPAALRPTDVGELVEPLTSRELEDLQLIAAGDSNRTIADKLVVTVSAVKKHTSNIFDKLDVGSRTQAIVRARQLGLLSEDR
jgi:LuxR family maltose regulon positive regulatory protein